MINIVITCIRHSGLDPESTPFYDSQLSSASLMQWIPYQVRDDNCLGILNVNIYDSLQIKEYKK